MRHVDSQPTCPGKAVLLHPEYGTPVEVPMTNDLHVEMLTVDLSRQKFDNVSPLSSLR